MGEGFSEYVFYLTSAGVIFYGVLVSSLLLFTKSAYRNANKMLALIMIIGTWYVIAASLVLTGNFVHIASFFRIGLPTFYAVPPLIWWYVKARTDRHFELKPIDYLHLLPVFLAAIDCIPFHLLSAEEKVNLVRLMSQDLRKTMDIRSGIIPDYLHFFMRPIQGVIYTILTAIYLKSLLADKKTRKEIKDQKGLKTWFILFISFFTLIYLGLFFTNFVWIGLPYSLQYITKIALIPSSLCVGIFLLIHIFFFFNSGAIFGKEQKVKLAIANNPVTKNSFPEPKKEEPLTDIDRLIIDKELFKNPKITAPEIATLIGIPPHSFSSILNNQYGKRFPDFINSFRINYVISELNKGSNENMSIEGIASEAGFASRSAFYNSFKKITGLTPSEYLKKQEEDMS